MDSTIDPKLLDKKNAHKYSRICLIMAFKNHAATIIDCLNSVKDIVDLISLVDVDSTDGTFDMITAWAHQNQIRTHIHRSTIIANSVHNITAIQQSTLIMAYKMMMPFEYFLFLDQPMIVNVDVTFSKFDLADIWYGIRYTKYSSFNQPALFKSELHWKLLGVSNPYWYCIAVEKSINRKSIGYFSKELERSCYVEVIEEIKVENSEVGTRGPLVGSQIRVKGQKKRKRIIADAE